MRAHSLVFLIGIGAVAGTFLVATGSDRFPSLPAQPKQAQPRQAQPKRAQPKRAQPKRAQPKRAQPKRAQPKRAQYGHLILQLEGDVHGLNVTWITPKTTGYNKTRVESPFEIDLFGGAGAKLGTYPIDLSRFDTDPALIGKPLRVEGCEVLDSKIVTIVNVPYFEQTRSMRIRNAGIVIGRLGVAQITKLMEQGEVR